MELEMVISRMVDDCKNDDCGRYPIVESYNLPLGEVPSRIKPFTSPLNLAETHLNSEDCHIDPCCIPFPNHSNIHLYCARLIRVWN